MTEAATGMQPWPEVEPAVGASTFDWKLWIYTNYNCNLSCTYCVAESSPHAPRRGLSVETVCRIVDEAVALGFQRFFFTGGEPFILDDIYEMLAYAAARAETIVLTNASLFRGPRLDRLAALPPRAAGGAGEPGRRPARASRPLSRGRFVGTDGGGHPAPAGARPEGAPGHHRDAREPGAHRGAARIPPRIGHPG